MTRYSRSKRRGRGASRPLSTTTLAFIVFTAVAGVFLCVGAIILAAMAGRGRESSTTATVRPGPTTLVVAYTPEKGPLFTALVKAFNDTRPQGPRGETLRVEAVQRNVETMLNEAVISDTLQAISPDSSLWLDSLDRAWRSKTGGEAGLVGSTHRYAVTPVVIAAWESAARSLGWPDKTIGWVDILNKARSDANFKWNHAATTSASGMLATLAEFYAGAGKTRGLTKEDATAQKTLDYVAAIERTVRFYGEGELAIIERARSEGRNFLDAFILPEQLVVQFNQAKPRERIVAIYPQEGTLWLDHPLVLLERPDLSANQRLAFQKFREFLMSAAAQKMVLQAGYRPADLNLSLTGPDSPLTAVNGVDPAQPQTTLQVPTPDVVEVVQNVWWYTKRRTNVYLVVDTSGSMRGEKIEAVREALRTFLDQIKGDADSVGMVEFSSQVNNIIPLDSLGNNRGDLERAAAGLQAGGDTALLDGVRAAYVRLQQENDRERINAIVALTDGRENASSVSLRQLTREMQQGNQSGVPVVVFGIAFGKDADLSALQSLANATNGQVRRGDLETIRQLYKILSTYF
ncbi:MAG: substrate-binding domain-containing protein [Anaerolineae bacterium]|nr:substrate-binding domain-containing protein [Anaerolineae bacterium]